MGAILHDRGVPTISADLLELAASYDVATEYWDWRGRRVEVPAATIEAVLAAMDVDTSDPAAALTARREAPWRRLLPPSVVVMAGEAATFWVHLPDGDPVEVLVELEDGGTRRPEQVDERVEPRVVDGVAVGQVTFTVPEDLPLGYHTIRATTRTTTASTALVVTPAWLGMPA